MWNNWDKMGPFGTTLGILGQKGYFRTNKVFWVKIGQFGTEKCILGLMSVLFIVICPIKYFGTKLGSFEQSSSIWDKIGQFGTKWDNFGQLGTQ